MAPISRSAASAPLPGLYPAEAVAATAAAGFDPQPYIGLGDWYNCSKFRSEADAQAVLRADPSGPNGLDRDRDGIACERNPEAYDLSPGPRV